MTQFIVHYPPGKTVLDGVTTENSILAEKIVRTLDQGGSACVPVTAARFMEDLGSPGVSWSITVIDETGRARSVPSYCPIDRDPLPSEGDGS